MTDSDAQAAEKYAYRLQNDAQRNVEGASTPRTPPSRARAHSYATFAQSSLKAAEAFEVAADAYEDIDDMARADILRGRARYNYVEAFTSTHTYLTNGFYRVSDAEAHALAKRRQLKPPKPGFFLPVSLSHAGPHVELHRLILTESERWRLKRTRPWVYALSGGTRMTTKQQGTTLRHVRMIRENVGTLTAEFDAYHDHLEICGHCTEHPFHLCPNGARLLEHAVKISTSETSASLFAASPLAPYTGTLVASSSRSHLGAS